MGIITFDQSRLFVHYRRQVDPFLPDLDCWERFWYGFELVEWKEGDLPPETAVK